jgi:nucleotide-binding universal stress UspA family protein
VVFPEGRSDPRTVEQVVRAEAHTKLEERAAPMRARGLEVTCEVILDDPGQAIVEAGKRADAIVIATHGRTGLAHVLLGSVAERVVRRSSVPVLTMRAKATSGASSGRGGGTDAERALEDESAG